MYTKKSDVLSALQKAELDGARISTGGGLQYSDDVGTLISATITGIEVKENPHASTDDEKVVRVRGLAVGSNGLTAEVTLPPSMLKDCPFGCVLKIDTFQDRNFLRFAGFGEPGEPKTEPDLGGNFTAPRRRRTKVKSY